MKNRYISEEQKYIIKGITFLFWFPFVCTLGAMTLIYFIGK